MRKGLKNLVAVAVALLGVNAMAMAPVISDIPSPIVGDSDGSTGTGVFVYEDAFDLDAYVSDDFTADEDIVWSYTTAAGRYTINGVGENAGDPNAPDAGTAIITDATTDTTGYGPDNDPSTITIVDVDANTNGLADVGADAEASDVVTLFASDVTTYSMKEVIFYTDSGGEDRLSSSLTPVVTISFVGGSTDWTPYTIIPATPATSLDPTNGLCFTVNAGEAAFAGWQSPAASAFELVDNNLYVIRMSMNTTSALDAQPIIAYTLNNTAGALDNGFAYGGQEFFVDQQGSANAIATLSGDYRYYYAPPQVGVAGWRSTTTGAFAAANAALKDFRLEYNLFSVRDELGSNTDAGSVCMSAVDISRVAIDGLSVAAADVYAESNFSAANFGAASALDIIGSATFSYTGGNVVYTPTNAELTVHDLGPGDTTFTDTGAGATDNFPVAWNASELYQINWSIAQGAGQSNDAIQFVVGQPTVENFTTAYVAVASNALGGAGLPVPGGSAEPLVQFYYTHGGTANTSGFAPAWRPVIQIANRTDLGVAQATSTLTIDSIDVDQLTLP